MRTEIIEADEEISQEVGKVGSGKSYRKREGRKEGGRKKGKTRKGKRKGGRKGKKGRRDRWTD